MRAMAAPQDVQDIVAAHAPHFSVVEEDGRVKIKCELNGHTFPARADALEAFISGKKYAKLVKDARLGVDLKKYEPFIVRSKNVPGMLFCALTGELLNARLHEVRAHLKGRKFGRAKERFEADEQELLEEPDLADEMEEDGQEGSDGPGFWVPEEVLQEYEMADAEGPEGATADEGAEQGGDADGDGEEEATEQAGGKTGKVASAKQRQEKQPRAKGRSKGGKPAAADGDKPAAGGNGKQRQKAAGGNGKQRQQGKQQKPQAGQDKGAANGSAGGSGKGKAPKAKRARTS